jgi:hypothetical protein
MRLVTAVIVPAVLVTAVNAQTERARRIDRIVKVKAAATAPDRDGRQVVTVTLDINKEYGVYANPAGSGEFKEDFKPVEMKVTVSAGEKLKDVKVDYPAAETHTITCGGEPLPVSRLYHGTVNVRVHVRRVKGDTSALEVNLACTPYHPARCYPPAAFKLKVP